MGGIIALLLAGIVTITAGIGSAVNGMWFKNSDIRTWFNSWGKGETRQAVETIEIADTTIAIDNNGNQLQQGKVYTLPRGIMFTSSTTTSNKPSVTVRATVSPDNADDKRVIWSSSNANSVTVTADEDDCLTATITCLDTLVDGQVYITCTSVDNPDAKAVCTIDYLINGSAIEFVASIDGDPSEIVFGDEYTVSARWDNTTPGAGTVMGDISDVSWAIELTYEITAIVDSYLAESGYDVSAVYYDAFESSSYAGTLFETPYDCFYGGSIDCDPDDFNHAFKMAMLECETHAIFSIGGNYSYKGKSYKYGSKNIPVSFSMSGIWISVDNVEVDNDNILFGT